MCPTYEFKCHTCEHITDHNYKFAERPETMPCSACGDMAMYTTSMPNIMHVALPDGTRRKGWDVMKEASKLQKAAYKETNPDTKNDLKKEIKKMGVRTEQ